MKLKQKRQKNIFIKFFLLIILIFAFAIFTAAEQLEEDEEVVIEAPKAGITPDSPFYFIDEVVEEIKLATKDGDERVKYALEIAKEKAAEAQQMAAENNTAALAIALINAKNISALIESEISPELEKQVEADSKEIQNILKQLQEQLPDEEKIKQLYDSLSDQVAKNRLAGKLASKVISLCEQLASIDYTLMEQEEKCNPNTAPAWLKKYIETDIKNMQQEATNTFVNVLKSCVQDIQNCQCQKIPIQKMKTYCEKEKKLIILCEFEENEEACQKLESEGEYAGEELLPEFMREKFRQIMDESEDMMFEKFAPKECIDAGVKTREDCEKIMIEKHGEPPEECSENGKFIGEKECTEKMIASGEMPEECVTNGKFIGEEQCIKKMVESGKMPKQCMDDGKFIGREECGQKMMDSEEIPNECVKNGKPIEEEACITKMKDVGKIPNECFDGDKFIGREACEAKFDSKDKGRGEYSGEYRGEDRRDNRRDDRGDSREDNRNANDEENKSDRIRPPEECIKDGEFIGRESCETMMREKYQEKEKYNEEFLREDFPEGDFQEIGSEDQDNKIYQERNEKDEKINRETVGRVIRKAKIPTMQQGFPIGENYGEHKQFNFMDDLRRMQQEGRINLDDKSIKNLNPDEIQKLLHDAKQENPDVPDFTDVQRFQKEIEKLEQDRDYIGNERDSSKHQENKDGEN